MRWKDNIRIDWEESVYTCDRWTELTVAGFDLTTTSALVYWLVDWLVYQINIARGPGVDPGRCRKKNKTTGVTVEQSHECMFYLNVVAYTDCQGKLKEPRLICINMINLQNMERRPDLCAHDDAA
jgi:hypothetical protein